MCVCDAKFEINTYDQKKERANVLLTTGCKFIKN